MDFTNIIHFLKTDIRGLILLGIITSLIAAALYDFGKKQLLHFLSILKLKSQVQKIKRLATYYASGYAAGYAHTSSYRQSVLVGVFIIRIIIQIGWCLFSLLLFLALLILVGQPFSWIFVVFFSALITFQYRKLKDIRGQYQAMIDAVFGEDFFEKQAKGVKEFINEKLKTE